MNQRERKRGKRIFFAGLKGTSAAKAADFRRLYVAPEGATHKAPAIHADSEVSGFDRTERVPVNQLCVWEDGVGMTIGERSGPVAEPNVVPLIDVLLVLIIIFLVITPQVPTGLPTLAPQPAPPQSHVEQPQAVVVQVMPGGKLMINQDHSDWRSLGARLADVFKNRAEKVAFVKGADEVPFEDVARAIDIMRGAGIEHVGLIAARSRNTERKIS